MSTITNEQEHVAHLVCPECGRDYEDLELEYCSDDGARLREIERADQSSDPLVGEVLDDRFRLDSKMDEGGMGRIYIGEQLSVERPVAIKTLLPQMESKETIAKRFLREARVISKFSHPNVVNLIDFGEDAEHELFYLVMELLDGVAVDELIERGRLTPPLAVQVASQVCAGLAEAHTEDVIHRDLKPENLIVVPLSDGRIETKLLDFGVARSLQDEATQLTKSGSVLGTPYYMAPEQARDGEIGPYTDVYAVGAILFEMITGHRPVEGDTSMSIMLQHVEGEVPSLSASLAGHEVPGSLARLVDSTLAPSHDDRPQTPLEVRNQLRDVQRSLGDPPMIAPSEDFETMFEPWIREPLSVPEENQGRFKAQTGAKPSAPKTGEHTESPVEKPAPKPDGGEAPDSFEKTAASPAQGSPRGEPGESGGENSPPPTVGQDESGTREGVGGRPRDGGRAGASGSREAAGNTSDGSEASEGARDDDVSSPASSASINTKALDIESLSTLNARTLGIGALIVITSGVVLGLGYAQFIASDETDDDTSPVSTATTENSGEASSSDPTGTSPTPSESPPSESETNQPSAGVAGKSAESNPDSPDASPSESAETRTASSEDKSTPSSDESPPEPPSESPTTTSESSGERPASDDSTARGGPAESSGMAGGDRAPSPSPDDEPADSPSPDDEAPSDRPDRADRDSDDSSAPGSSSSDDESAPSQPSDPSTSDETARVSEGGSSPSNADDSQPSTSEANADDSSSSEESSSPSDSTGDGKEASDDSDDSSEDESANPGFFPAE